MPMILSLGASSNAAHSPCAFSGAACPLVWQDKWEHIRHGEGARSGRGPVAKLLVREAARTTARLYRTFRYDIVRLKRENHPLNQGAGEAGAASTHACTHYPSEWPRERTKPATRAPR